MTARTGNLRRDAALLLSGGMVTRLCGFVFIMILSRTLSERQIGLFSFAEALADTLILIASFNLDSLIVRRIAGGPPEEATARFAPLLGFRLVSGPVYLIVIFLASRLMTGETRWLLPAVGLLTLIESLFFCLSDIFVGINRPAVRAGIEVTAELLFTPCFIVAMLLHPSLTTLVWVSGVRAAVLIGGVLYMARMRLGRLHIGWDNRLLREGAPFLLMTFLTIVQGKTETVLLGVMSDYTAVGVFQLALRLFMAALFIPQALSSAIFPRFAATGLDVDNRRRLMRGLLGLILIGLAGSVFLLAVPVPAARIMYGPAALQVIPVLRSMAPLLPLRFAILFLAAALAALSREREVLIALAAGTGVGLLTDVALIPHFGAVGASFGLLASAICQCILLIAPLMGLLRRPPAAATTIGVAVYAPA